MYVCYMFCKSEEKLKIDHVSIVRLNLFYFNLLAMMLVHQLGFMFSFVLHFYLEHQATTFKLIKYHEKQEKLNSDNLLNQKMKRFNGHICLSYFQKFFCWLLNL